ncbi:hypothetical protein [Larkinella rosea]|uniref:Uncharacterized protein n=1 Tax=Larkinella rosea TaxID=2025312 RepID=A0A3P1C3A5_9BACT|nr:hypothetical protein [Larkinella rosea]RRB07543.1 hypothetical protein EHT25_07115 [Larkinella rosea]
MRIRETVLISLAVGCLLLWILEFRRTRTFGEHYWLIMLCLAFLLAFMYVRGMHLNRPAQKPSVPAKQSGKKKRKS